MADRVPRLDVASRAKRPKTWNANEKEPDMTQTTRVDAADLPVERWDDPQRGSIAWRTLISANMTPTKGMTCGIAMLDPGDFFALHQHDEPEVYFGLSGDCAVMIDGIAHHLGPQIALFIAGNALHGIRAVEQPVRFFYCFACDSFDQIAYRFAKESA